MHDDPDPSEGTSTAIRADGGSESDGGGAADGNEEPVADGSPDADGGGGGTEHPVGEASATERPVASEGRSLDLGLALAEHRPYVLVAVVLFAVGVLAGVGLALADVNLLEVLGYESFDEVFEGVEFTATSIFLNNIWAYLLMVGGAVTLGLLTVTGLGFNGLLVGWVVGLFAMEDGIGIVLLAILPHGILELPALWIGAGIGFRLVAAAVNYLRGRREQFLTRAELGRTVLLFVAGIVLLAIAAVIEVHVTPAIVEAVYGTPEPGTI